MPGGRRKDEAASAAPRSAVSGAAPAGGRRTVLWIAAGGLASVLLAAVLLLARADDSPQAAGAAAPAGASEGLRPPEGAAPAQPAPPAAPPPVSPYPESFSSSPPPPPPSQAPPTAAATTAAAPLRLTPRVVAVYPHDPNAFTQGLVWHAGALYESTGQYGDSTLRRVNLATGAVERRVDLPPNLFGEGLARVGDRLIQLTWQEGVALVWGLERFERRGEHRYGGEGWGLCHDGRRLVMSDGSARLVFRDPESFAPAGELAVTLDGRAAGRLNELECVGGDVWANVWGSDDVLRIDGASGRVTAVVDASGLLSPLERAGSDVLNGIAHRAEKSTFLLTGKLWPRLFEVVFEPAP